MTSRDHDDPKPVRVDICVCTYRRAEIEDALRSLGAMRVPGHVSVRVIVADNDDWPSAEEPVTDMAAELPFEVVYLHAPASNISIARNACLEHADGDLLAFIDDDEVVARDWLAELVAAAEASGADAILGPVRSVYSDTAPGWMRRGDFHSTMPVWVKGEIRTGYTCNVILRRASRHVAGRRFNLARGRSGGEDTEFFTQLTGSGGTIAFAPDAVVHEAVPDSRASFSWLLRRRFRAGQTHGRLLAEPRRGGLVLAQVVLAGAKAGYCFAAAAVVALLPVRRNRYFLRGVLHAGVISALLGLSELRLYGAEPIGGRGNAA
jgi:succinoglycan biosynthesis protein ExoM